TSCPGCVKEMPHLADTWRKYHQRGLEVVAVAMSYDPPEYVRNYTRQRALPFTVALDVDGKAAQAFNQVKLTPTTFIIGKDGHILQQTLGELDFVTLHALLEQQLGDAS
ncbi:MAG: TlpA disulfide reductase family protein, partial [Sulfurimicrobium sp.]|nr:TlpA disulfide reductase family protein [Sulfurimicrobium sp.]